MFQAIKLLYRAAAQKEGGGGMEGWIEGTNSEAMGLGRFFFLFSFAVEDGKTTIQKLVYRG